MTATFPALPIWRYNATVSDRQAYEVVSYIYVQSVMSTNLCNIYYCGHALLKVLHVDCLSCAQAW